MPIQFLLLFRLYLLTDIYTYRNLQESAQPAVSDRA